MLSEVCQMTAGGGRALTFLGSGFGYNVFRANTQLMGGLWVGRCVGLAVAVDLIQLFY